VSESVPVKRSGTRAATRGECGPSCARRSWAVGTTLALAALLVGCASAPSRRPTSVDLSSAREAVARARSDARGAPTGECLTRAEEALARAETLASSQRAQDREEGALLGRLALVGAQCALESAARKAEAQAEADKRGQEIEHLNDELRKAQEAQRRSEERAALLARDLEQTESEVVRSKAHLKRLATKAETSAAIAEARILVSRVGEEARMLVRRAGEEPGASSTLARCQKLLTRADQQLREENYGAAVFFAQRAQDLLESLRRPARPGSQPERGGSPKRGPG
jgi:hypothetical protein